MLDVYVHGDFMIALEYFFRFGRKLIRGIVRISNGNDRFEFVRHHYGILCNTSVDIFGYDRIETFFGEYQFFVALVLIINHLIIGKIGSLGIRYGNFRNVDE